MTCPHDWDITQSSSSQLCLTCSLEQPRTEYCVLLCKCSMFTGRYSLQRGEALTLRVGGFAHTQYEKAVKEDAYGFQIHPGSTSIPLVMVEVIYRGFDHGHILEMEKARALAVMAAVHP